jgi:hypothetical protein
MEVFYLNRIIVVLLVLLSFSCKNKNSSIGELDLETMVVITKDLTIAESALRLDYVSQDYQDDKAQLFFDICKSYNVDTSLYSSTLKLYEEDFTKLNVLFEKVGEFLALEKAQISPPANPEVGGY